MDWSRIVNGLGSWAARLQEGVGVPLNLLTAGLILLIGWLAAHAFKRLAKGAVGRLGRALPSPGADAPVREGDLERTAHVVGSVVYWVLLALAVMAATERMGLPIVAAWLSGVANYLPRVVVAVLIVAAGLPLSRLGAAAATRAATSSGVPDGRRLGRFVELAGLAVTALIAIETLGIDVSFLQLAILVVLASVLLGAALAFALGARELIADILACHYVLRLYKSGQLLRVEGDAQGRFEGRLLRVVPPCVILDTPEGEVAVPARRILSGYSMLLPDPTLGREGPRDG